MPKKKKVKAKKKGKSKAKAMQDEEEEEERTVETKPVDMDKFGGKLLIRNIFEIVADFRQLGRDLVKDIRFVETSDKVLS